MYKRFLIYLGFIFALAAPGIYFSEESVHRAIAQSPIFCPTRPPGDNTNACASTAFVAAAGVGGGTLTLGTTATSGFTNGNVITNNAGVLGQVAPSTTVNGTVCTLGSTCSPTATATSVTVGTTTVLSATNTDVLTDNAGVMGQVAPSVTVNGTLCTLGSTCSPTATATSVTSGTTTVAGPCTSGFNLYDNAGVVGCQAGGGLTNLSTSIASGTAYNILGDNGGTLKEVPPDGLHSAAWGVVADGATNNNTNMQTWISACISQNKACILDETTAGCGALITTTMSVNSTVTIVGINKYNSAICIGATNTFAFTSTATETAPGITFGNFQITTTNALYGSCTGCGGIAFNSIASHEIDHSVVNGVVCNGIDTCTDYERAGYWSNFQQECLALTNKCITVRNLTNPDTGDNTIIDMKCVYASTSSNNNEVCVYQTSSGGLKIAQSKMLNGFRGYQLNIDSGTGTGNIQLVNNSIENFYDSGIFLGQAVSGSGTFVRGLIVGNEILQTASNSKAIWFAHLASAGWIKDFTIAGNSIEMQAGTNTGILIYDLVGLGITGNVINCESFASTNGIILDGTVNQVAHSGNLNYNCTTGVQDSATNSSGGY